MKYLNKKGVVTVFLLLILPALLLSCLALTDAAVLLTGGDMAKQAVEAGAYAVMGNYSGYLKEKYDIYGMCMSEAKAHEIVEEVISNSLKSPDLYDFNIEDIKICFSESLFEPDVLKKAVVSVAKDDLYKNTITGFIDKLNIFSGFNQAADIIKLKMQVDEAVAKFRTAGEKLTDIVNGDNDTQFYINNIFGITGLSEEADEITRIFKEMETLKSEIDQLKKEAALEESEDVGGINIKEEALGILRQTAADLYYSGMERVVNGLHTVNEEALEYLKTMLKEKVNINILSDLINQKIAESEELPEYIKEMLLSVADVIRDIETEAVNLAFDIIEEEINQNIDTLFGVSEYIENSIDDIPVSDSLVISDELDRYNADISFIFSKSGLAGTEEDKRGFFEELGKRVLEKRIGEDVEISSPELLPSAYCIYSSDKSDFNVMTTGESTKSAEEGMDDGAAEQSPIFANMTDELCINEYLLNHLSFETTQNSNESFFNNEIEYILWGAPNQNLNRFYTKSALMGTRFALNAIHVYTDVAKKTKADIIATATAGWWTAGAGIPLMSNLIKCSWAIAESGFDVNKLCSGSSVAIVKRKADWITDIGLASAGVKSPEVLCMNYEDYLRIYLLLNGSDKKMVRLADIIQLNAKDGFSIFSAYTKITIRAVISFKSLTGGRHEEIIEISRQYNGDGVS